MGEEAAHEDVQPMVYELFCIFAIEGDASHIGDFFACETISQEVVEKEVV
jgi:hypothetical protein